jgi:hypothetical protein
MKPNCHPERKHYAHGLCKRCYMSARLRNMKITDPEKYRIQHIDGRKLRRYGLTFEQYDQMYVDQNGLCAICETPLVKHCRGTNIDHNHLTGENRGLLCDACNWGLGHFKEDVKILQRSIEYLTKRGSACG